MKEVKTFLIALAVLVLSSCTPDEKPVYTFPSADDFENVTPEPKPEPTAKYEHKDAEGNILFTTESETETLEVGMNASPDGKFTLPNDLIVTIVEGKITEIAEVEKPIVDPSATPCFIWIDAAANFPDFANSKENIARDLKTAAEAGFTDIVVDVRPTTGDVLFQTTKCQQVEWLGAWVTGGYGKITRTATWDYLQAFIDEGHKLGLRVYAGFNTMVGGNTTSRGSQGVLFRDDNMKQYATKLNTDNGIISIMDSDYSTKFFNPVHPEVQEYIIGLLEDLAAYEDLDGIILDRCRFDGFESDFSDYTKAEFEKHIDATIENWPEDVLPVGAGYGTYNQKYTKQWHEFRAKVIHDFIVSARTAVKAVNPDINFGAYVGGWYASYYEVGVNWASPNYNTSANYSWATPAYKDYGYADHVDVLIIGAYASPGSVYGGNEWTMQGFCKLAKQKTMGDVGLLVGGPDVGNWDSNDKFSQEQENQAVKNSVKACADECDGYFLFDMIHLKKAAASGIDQWGLVKEGIDQLKSAN